MVSNELDLDELKKRLEEIQPLLPTYKDKYLDADKPSKATVKNPFKRNWWYWFLYHAFTKSSKIEKWVDKIPAGLSGDAKGNALFIIKYGLKYTCKGLSALGTYYKVR